MANKPHDDTAPAPGKIDPPKTVKAKNPANVRDGGLFGGTPGPGRPKGIPNRATQEVRELAGQLLESPGYRESLQRRLEDGTVAPAVEVMLWAYRWGKPKETIEVSGPDGGPMAFLAETLTTAERASRIDDILARAGKPQLFAAGCDPDDPDDPGCE